MAKHFSSVVFYKTSHAQSNQLRDTLSHSPLLKVFETTHIEEVQQIVNMSERTTVIFDKESETNVSITTGSNTARGHFRKYFFNWFPALDSRALITLNPQGTISIQSDKMNYAIEKIELYLFGVTNVHDKKTFTVPGPYQIAYGNIFFSHLHYVAQEWKMIHSTHEREQDVSKLIGKDWEKLMRTILSETWKYKNPAEEFLGKPYYEVIYPHIVEGELKRLSIIHLAYNSKVQDNVTNLYLYLEKH